MKAYAVLILSYPLSSITQYSYGLNPDGKSKIPTDALMNVNLLKLGKLLPSKKKSL